VFEVAYSEDAKSLRASGISWLEEYDSVQIVVLLYIHYDSKNHNNIGREMWVEVYEQVRYKYLGQIPPLSQHIDIGRNLCTGPGQCFLKLNLPALFGMWLVVDNPTLFPVPEIPLELFTINKFNDDLLIDLYPMKAVIEAAISLHLAQRQ
jgi:hypothetical protein